MTNAIQSIFGNNAHAQFSNLQNFVNNSANVRGARTLSNAQTIVGEIGNFIIYLGAAAIIIGVIWAGLMYMRAGANEQMIDEAKRRFKWTIVGVVVIMGTGVILKTIDTILKTGSIS